MTETLTKPLTLAEVKVAAHLLRQEDPALTVARYAHRMPEVTKQLDESIRQTQSGTRTHLDHMVARCRLDAEHIQVLQNLGTLPRNEDRSLTRVGME